MTSKGFKLNDNQKLAVRQFYHTGNFDGVNVNTIHALENKGVIAFTEEPLHRMIYRKPFFTPEGQAWTDVQFGSSDPAPVRRSPYRDEWTYDVIRQERMDTATPPPANAQSAPVATPDPVASTPEPAQPAPVADSELPFASFDSEPVSHETKCRVCGEPLFNVDICMICEANERGDIFAASFYREHNIWHKLNTATIWTHSANDMPRPHAIGWRGIHQAAWLFAERTGVTGHGRVSRNRANKGQKRGASKHQAKQVMMQRNKALQGQIRQNYAIAQMEFRRQQELEHAAAIETSRRMVNINQQMRGYSMATAVGRAVGQAA